MPQGTGTGTAYDEMGICFRGSMSLMVYVTAAADALSVAGTVTGHASLGRVGAAVSVRNDHGVQNLVMTGASFVPVVGEAVGAVGIVYDVGDFAGHWITNNIMAPMINAIPGKYYGQWEWCLDTNT